MNACNLISGSNSSKIIVRRGRGNERWTQESSNKNEDDRTEPQIPPQAKYQGLTYHLDVENRED